MRYLESKLLQPMQFENKPATFARARILQCVPNLQSKLSLRHFPQLAQHGQKVYLLLLRAGVLRRDSLQAPHAGRPQFKSTVHFLSCLQQSKLPEMQNEFCGFARVEAPLHQVPLSQTLDLRFLRHFVHGQDCGSCSYEGRTLSSNLLPSVL